MNKYNVCIIGCGSVGGLRNSDTDNPESKVITTHAKAVYEARKKGLVDKFYVCDIDVHKTADAVNKWDAKGVYGISEIDVIDDNIDIFIVATPTNTHHQVMLDILKLNQLPKTVICEKPFTDNLKDAKEISKLYKEKGINIAINYTRNYCDDILSIGHWLNTNYYGKIRSCNLKYTRGLLRDGSHAIDLFNKFFGKFKDARILNETGFNDFSDNDLTLPVYLQYEHCDNIFMIPCDGRDYSIFDMEILTEKKRILFTDHFRKVFEYPVEKEAVYGNFNTMSPYYTSMRNISLESAIYRVLENATANLNSPELCGLRCTDENAIKVHEVYKRLGM
jgi:predicted dehydrogenase